MLMIRGHLFENVTFIGTKGRSLQDKYNRLEQSLLK